MKRKLALFLALVMVLSLVPANVFASTSNRIDRVPAVADDHVFDEDDAPVLRIEEDDVAEFGTTTQTFKLKLTNAEWDSTSIASLNAALTTGGAGGNLVVTASYVSASTAQIEMKATADSTTEYWVKLPLVVEVTDAGAVKVEVDGVDSAVSGGTYTFANASGGDTTTSVDDTVTFGDTVVIEDVLIEEMVIGTLADGEINIKLTDSDFNWDDTAVTTVTFSGGLTAATITETYDDNIYTLEFDINDNATARGNITIEGLTIDADSDADYGEVMVKVYGDDVTTETFKVADYVDYEVTVKADDDEADLPEIYAGYLEHDGFNYNVPAAGDVVTDSEDNDLSILIIEEEIASSWLTERRTKIAFADEVKIMYIEVDDTDNLDTNSNNVEDSVADVQGWLDGQYDLGDSSVELNGIDKFDSEGETTLDLIFYVSVEADFEGDIIATVSGSSLEQDFEVKLGTAVAPIEVETTVTDVKIGLQDQKVGTVTITEADAEVLASGDTITLTLDDEIEFAATPDVTVTEGDLTIDDVEKDGNVITITIDDESTDASTFEITGILVDVDRTVAEGDFNVTIGGTAIIKNYQEDGDDFFFDTDSIADVAFARVITPTDYDVKSIEDVVFTIDSMEYKIGDTVVTMDAAPFIDAANRTMLPLRAFANALGVSDTDILWNGTERSVTIFKGDAVVKVVIGEMSFMKNGVSVPMDTQAVIKDGRTFLPVRALGQALGATIEWDAATRSVTIK